MARVVIRIYFLKTSVILDFYWSLKCNHQPKLGKVEPSFSSQAEYMIYNQKFLFELAAPKLLEIVEFLAEN